MSQSHPAAVLVRCLDCFSEWTGRTVAWMTLLMVLGTFVVVVQRYVFNQGNTALQESIIYMHSLVFLLGAAYTLKHDGHVRVDIIYRPLGEKGKAWINLFGTLFLLMPVCIFHFLDVLGLCSIILVHQGSLARIRRSGLSLSA
jgi:TRAP-type mannitol/chloroaromatic compound transport system permease small subunit